MTTARWRTVALSVALALFAGCAELEPQGTAPAKAVPAFPVPAPIVPQQPIRPPEPPPPSSTVPAFPAVQSATGVVGGSSVAPSHRLFFDFNAATVKPEHRPTLEAIARQLVQSRGARIVLEGHCDDRGSREFNVALGQRRAEAVKRALVSLGAAPVQIDAASFGKEKPIASGPDEEARAKNRRVDVVFRREK
jgi:peptidoglycan-associated lipoprotein